MTSITFKGISKSFEKRDKRTTVLSDVNLHISSGEFAVFVGPSGCGKSTMLRIVAGLESVSSGALLFDDEAACHLAPGARRIGMVFQSYALYPHMSVEENLAFPLRMAGTHSKVEIVKAVHNVAEMFEIGNVLKSQPRQLSGGQQQRVAIGRALIKEPKIFLLDEPLSNLDSALRSRMRLSLAEYHKQFGCTVIYVTHDQTEAMTLADKVVLLNHGSVEQVGTPQELFLAPRSLFVAEFIGSPKMNVVPVTYVGSENGGARVRFKGVELLVNVRAECIVEPAGGMLRLGVRPEDLRIGFGNHFQARAIGQEYMGPETIVYAKVDGIDELILLSTAGDVVIREGSIVNIAVPGERSHLFGRDGIAVPRIPISAGC